MSRKRFFSGTFRKGVMPKGTTVDAIAPSLTTCKVGLTPRIQRRWREAWGSSATPPRSR